MLTAIRVHNGDVERDYTELLKSPYEDDDPGPKRWLLVLAAVGVVGVVIVGVVLWMGGEPSDPSTEPAASPGNPTRTTSTTAPSQSGSTTTTTLVAPGVAVVDGELGPAPTFDVSQYGTQQELGFVPDDRYVPSRWEESGRYFLDVGSIMVAGAIPETYGVLVTSTGTIADPFNPSFGADGTCFTMSFLDGDQMDCFAYNAPGSLRPVFVGFFGSGVMAWGMLPEDSSVALLVVDGIPTAWQRPSGGVVAFAHDVVPGEVITLFVYDAAGNELGRSDRVPVVDEVQPVVDVVEGYGDYSGVPFDEVDFAAADLLIVECVADGGFDVVTYESFGEGFHAIDYSMLPDEERREGLARIAGCVAGLHIAQRPESTLEDQREWFEILSEIRDCLVDAGFAIAAPPPFDEWVIDSPDTQWNPLILMHIQYPEDGTDSYMECQPEPGS